MSDFKNIRDFRKNSLIKYPYQDPTRLSFVMLFDFVDTYNSPLLSKAAEDYLEKLAKDNSFYSERLEALKNFKKALKVINNEMPWFWQSLSGLEKIQQYDTTNPYFGGADAKLTISTLESINLTVAGLMHLYRTAVFDERKWTYILPPNLRRFRMYVYVTEIRTIQNISKPTLGGIPTKINGDAVEGFPDNFKPSIKIENDNKSISGQTGRPYFMFGLKYCEFDIASGTSAFADLNKNPESAVGEISISYQGLDKIESRVLNGIIKTDYGNDNLSPAPDSENYSPSSLKDFAKDKINGKISEIEDRAKDDLKRIAREKALELKQAAEDATVNRVPSIDNIYQNLVQGVDNAANPTELVRNISANISENIFDVQGGVTIGDQLGGAAANSLGNVND